MKWRKHRDTWILKAQPYEGWVCCLTNGAIAFGIYNDRKPIYFWGDDKGLTIHTPKAARKWIGYKIKELLERRGAKQ